MGAGLYLFGSMGRSAPMPLVLGSKLGPYQLDALMHSDGRGDVYRGKDLRLGRVVAIKVLPVHISKKAESRDEFEREALALSLLDHPNICRLYDIGYQDELDYLIMEYLEGKPG
jgi:eukaryotic-like serine/threonine-protein kinase